jgi:competence protein ComFC
MYQTFLKPLFVDIKTFVLDTLFPISCLSCGKEGAFTQHHFSDDNQNSIIKNTDCSISTHNQDSTKSGAGFICGDCRSKLKKLEHQRCIICQKNTPFGLTHPACLTPHGADGLISFYDYHDEKVSKIIIAGKYNFIPMSYEALGEIIAEKIKFNYFDLTSANSYELAYIPLHSTRQRWRGFNQAEVLCQSLSQNLGLACINVLVRCKITKTQKDLKKEGRLKNVADAFKLKSGADVHNKNIILVDDVTTTGATLQEAAKVLKRNGAAKVICLTVARD